MKIFLLKNHLNEYVKRTLLFARWLRVHFMLWIRSFNKADEEVEFYPAVLEVLETPPSPLGRTIIHVIMLFLTLAILWACIGSVDIIATAQGKIVPTTRIKTIQPLEAGVVHTIRVQDGQQVKANDVLIEIDSTISQAERDRLHSEFITASLDAARLKALVSDADNPMDEFVPPEDASKPQVETQKALLMNQLSEHKAKLVGLDQQIAQNEGNRSAVLSTIDKLTQSIPLLEERAKMRKKLSERGYGSKIDTLTVEQDLLEHQKELEVQQGRLAEATGGLESLREQRKQADAEFKRTQLDKLAEAQQKAASLQQQLLQASQKFRLQTLTSPVDGTVQQLAIHTEGGVVTPAQTLMVVVPADSHLEIEAMVSNRDIGFVHAGQEVGIKVDTFNFTRYGLLRGKVISVSRDAIMREKPAGHEGGKKQAGDENESSELEGQELVYAARISLDVTQMDIDGNMINLEPGMAVTAEIKTGHRHIISYLLSPLRKHLQQALREQ